VGINLILLMKYIQSRDIKRRFQYKKYEKKRFCFLYLLQQSEISQENKIKIAYKLNSLPKDSSITRIHNRCVLSNRGRSIDSKYKLSRIKMREFITQGLLPGYTRAVW
jgi:small subunit ribosomal protein S14